jgi:hypothetical protein
MMNEPRYVRNYVRAKEVEIGMPLRSVFLDNRDDLIVSSFYDDVIGFTNDSRTVPLTKSSGEQRFPYREDQMGWQFPPKVSDLAAGDTLDFLGTNIVVHDVYRRPGEDWVRLTTKRASGKQRGTRIDRAWCMLDDEVSNRVIRQGTRHWKEFPIEVSGKYWSILVNDYQRFYVSPLGRGDMPLVGYPHTGPIVVKPEYVATRAIYEFADDYDSLRHPSDGNVPRRKLR